MQTNLSEFYSLYARIFKERQKQTTNCFFYVSFGKLAYRKHDVFWAYGMKEYRIQTHRRVEFVDITQYVREAVAASRIRSGICVVYCPHTTGAITINEHADPDVVYDIGSALGRIVPHSWNYAHAEGNSDSHIQSSLVGASQTLIVHNGNLVLGTWQGIFFCEFDGPRERHFYVKIVADNEGS